MLTHEENYLTPNEIEHLIQTLKEITCNSYKVKPIDIEACARIQYGCGLRISEVLSLTPEDFDLDNLTLTLNHTKTGFKKCRCAKYENRKLVSIDSDCKKCKGLGKIRKPQFTTILASDVSFFREYLKTKRKNTRMFDFGRLSVWNYYKKAGNLAGLHVREQQDEKTIEGIWTHLLRKCRAKLMTKLGASEVLIKLKLRHNFTTTERYTKPDLQYLKMWEQENLKN